MPPINNNGHPAKPDFLIIGAQKCGTTWLHNHLRTHPDIFMPANKDLEFFSYRDNDTAANFNNYLNHFLQAGEALSVGEATASYFWSNSHSRWSILPEGFQSNIPGTVHQYLGEELKLLVTIRNPVSRTVSAYLHYLAMGEINAGTDFATAMTYGGVVDMGFYARHLNHWLEYYPLEQIKVLILEADIQARPVETLADVCRFLSVPAYTFPQETVQQTVFAGTRRLTNENGVFIASEGTPGNTEAPCFQDDDGQYWQQIISGDWLQKLNGIFLDDVKDLDSILGTQLVEDWGINP